MKEMNIVILPDDTLEKDTTRKKRWGNPPTRYASYEGLALANKNNRKLGVFGRKLRGSHSLFECYSD